MKPIPDVDPADAREILESCLGVGNLEISRTDAGALANSFRCSTDNSTVIIQFYDRTLAHELANEQRYRDQLVALDVPLRDVLGEGWHNGAHYTIYREPNGRGLDELSADELSAALPEVFDLILRIAEVDVGGTTGFGWMDENGNGMHDSWSAHLEYVGDEEPGMFFGAWHHMFDDTFLERDRFNRYMVLMRESLDSIDAPRRLVHGSFGYDRVRVSEGRVVALLNWMDARYGDTLYDVANMGYWWTHLDIVGLFQRHCSDRGVSFDDYRRRIAACRYFIALDCMRYFAKVDDRRAYDGAVAIAEAADRE